MVKVDVKMIKLLKEKELVLYKIALDNLDTSEIEHWERVAKSRDK